MLRTLLLVLLLPLTAFAQSERTFTYQGVLREAGALSSGSTDFRVQAYSAAGVAIGGMIFINDVNVNNGVFALAIDPALVPDLDEALGNGPVTLELAVAPSTAVGPSASYTVLSPRQSITSAPIAGSVVDGAITADKVNASDVQLRVRGTCSAGQAVQQVNQDGTVVCAASSSGWSLSGNAATDPAQNFLGTTDAQPLVFRTQDVPSLRLEANAITDSFGVPRVSTSNFLAGSALNSIDSGVRGSTVSGGGSVRRTDPDILGGLGPNRVTDHYGFVGGGSENRAGNATGAQSDAAFASVVGGRGNTASGETANVLGGRSNLASSLSSTVAGGILNTASGDYAIVAGGSENCAGAVNSFAAGQSAKVRPGTGSGAAGAGCIGVPTTTNSTGDAGTFVWADSQPGDFVSTGANQFLIRAQGGMAINSNNPAGNALRVNGLTRVDTLGTAGATALCRNSANQIASCAGGGGWGLLGNAGTDSAQNFIGTTDDEPLELRAGAVRALRLEPSAARFKGIPSTANVIAGSHANQVSAGVRGATIGGGGAPVGDSDPNFGEEAPNRVLDHYGTVAGGIGNEAGDGAGSLSDRPYAFVGGGSRNVASGLLSAIVGGELNTSRGTNSAIGGGFANRSNGTASAVPGGAENVASGVRSLAFGNLSCAGGADSVALGSRAKVRPASDPADSSACAGLPSYSGSADSGSFVFADSSATSSFISSGPNQFLLRAAGGMAVNTNDPAGNALRVNGLVRIDNFGPAGATAVCRNANNQLAQCSSSARYKHAIHDLALGLAAVSQLRPVAFNWNGSNEADVGFVAEEVAKLDPRLVVYNAAGQIEGVKYDRLSAVLAGAVQELGARNSLIEEQLARLREQQQQLNERLQSLETR